MALNNTTKFLASKPLRMKTSNSHAEMLSNYEIPAGGSINIHRTQVYN
jgi:hypothetical protein